MIPKCPAQVSVVIPTYNRAYILREALESVLAQTYRDFEIVVVDDGSCDNTREIVESFSCDKIRYIRHERNHGCSAAYNTGITDSQGSLVAFCDSDDMWKPDYLQRQVGFLCRHSEVDVVFCDTEVRALPGGAIIMPSLMSHMPAFRELIGGNAEAVEHVVLARQMYLCLLEEIPIKPTAAMARRAIFDRVGLFDEAWPSGTDWDLFLRLSRVASFGYIDEVLAIQRRTSDATHQLFREKDKLFLLSLFLKEKAALASDRDALRGVNRGICGIYNSLAWTYLESGKKQAALSTYCQGFKETLKPLLLKKLASAVLRVALGSVSRSS
jgi:glycosyltransferase involved in cell wall biosynthesis